MTNSGETVAHDPCGGAASVRRVLSGPPEECAACQFTELLNPDTQRNGDNDG